MTDRLAELTGGVSYVDDDDEEVDLENGGAQSMDDATRQAIENFQKEMDSLSTEIANVESATKELARLFENALRSTSERPENKARIAELLKENDNQSKTIRARLRKLGDENRAFKKEHPRNISELKLRVTQHQSIAKRFMGAMQDFETVQDGHRTAMNKKLEQYLRRMNPEASPDEIARAVRNGEASGFADGGTQFAQLPSAERERLQRGLADLNARNADIRQLEESIVQLHQLFVDMQIMVEAQGELLNQAEYDVGETKNATAAALDDLVTAREYQKSARRKKWWIIAIVAAIVVAVTIALLIRFAPGWVNRQAQQLGGLITGGGANATDPAPGPQPQPTPAAGASPNGSVAAQPAPQQRPSEAPLVPIKLGRAAAGIGREGGDAGHVVRLAQVIIGAKLDE